MNIEIGYYTCVCCLMDLHKIEDEDRLQQVKDGIEDEMPYRVFPSLADAVRELRGELSPADEAKELARLGWVEP